MSGSLVKLPDGSYAQLVQVVQEDDIYGGLVFTEKSDMILRITAVSASDTSVVGGYDLILVKN